MSQTVRNAPATITWCLEEDAPSLFEALQQEDPWAAGCAEELGDALPAASTTAPFDDPPYRRDPGHVRSFFQRGPQESIIATKGSEPLTADWVDFFRTGSQLRSPSPHPPHVHTSILSLPERFAVVEQKAPGALIYAEAAREARAAVAVQLGHLERYGGLARFPLPLRLGVWSDEVKRSYWRQLQPLLSNRARAVIEPMLADGIGCIVYHYPSDAPRVSNLPLRIPTLRAQLDFAGRLKLLEDHFDLDAAIEGWLELTSRLLATGFFPIDPYESYLQGACLQWQNAVLDGGFVDADSVAPMASIHSDRVFSECLLATAVELSTTIRKLLIGDLPVPNLEYGDPTLTTSFVLTRVWADLRRRIEEEAACKPLPHARLLRALGQGSLSAQLAAGLEDLFPPPEFPDSPVNSHLAGM